MFAPEDDCPPLHPNEIDRHRIARLLATRQRYRYVTPQVLATENGYCVVSPCCSRNIDASGGTIDIARLEYLPCGKSWLLYRKDHATYSWQVHARCADLAAVLACLNADPQRVFWQ